MSNVDGVLELAGGSPGQVVAEWCWLVDIVEDGYGLGLDAHEHDLGVRGRIEGIMTDDALNEMAWLRAEVAAIDERFRALLTAERIRVAYEHRWWWAHLLCYASTSLADDVESLYGVRIETR